MLVSGISLVFLVGGPCLWGHHQHPVTYRLERTHREQVSHHGRESGRQAALGDEAQLQLRQADDVVALLPVPRWDVQQVRLNIQIRMHQ